MATETTLASAQTDRSTSISLAGGRLLLHDIIALDGEYEQVIRLLSDTQALVQRGINGSAAKAHSASVDVTFGRPNEFLAGPQPIPVFGPSDDVLTAQGPSTAARYAAGGIVHQATVTLTNAQIKALPTVNFTILAAETGFIHYPSLVSWLWDTSHGGYTNIGLVATTGTVELAHGPSVDTDQDAQISVNGVALTSSTGIQGTTPFRVAESLFQFRADNLTITTVDDLIVWIDKDTVGDLTGGHALNSLIITTLYTKLNRSTGLLE